MAQQPKKAGRNALVITAWFGECLVRATLDTGCSQSLIQAELMPKLEVRWAKLLPVTCILGEEMQFNSCYTPIHVMEFQGELRVGLTQKLACELVIIREWEPTYDVLQRVRAAEDK